MPSPVHELRPGKIARADGACLFLLSRTVKHMAAHPDVTFNFIRAAFERTELPVSRKSLKSEVDFGRVIGRTSKVITDSIDPYDTATFAYRFGRRYPSRVVVGVPKPTTSILVLVAERDPARGEAAWVLETAYFGTNAPLEPLSGRVFRDNPETRASVLQFWCSHALIYDPGECVTQPFRSSWAALSARRTELGPEGFPEGGPYWTGD